MFSFSSMAWRRSIYFYPKWLLTCNNSKLIAHRFSLVQCSNGYSGVTNNQSVSSRNAFDDILGVDNVSEVSETVSLGVATADVGGAKQRPPSSHENPSVLYDPLSSKFVNMMMKDGRKSHAQSVFMEALEVIKRTQITKMSSSGNERRAMVTPMVIFHQAIENAKPSITTRRVKKGGKSFHVPCSMTEKRRQFLACKWIITSATQKRAGMNLVNKLAVDIMDTYNNKGFAMKKKQDLHRLAEANRAYSHYRW